MTKNRSRRNLVGFTLIELLVVVLILGVLTAVALPAYISSVQIARQGVVNTNARALAEAVQAKAVITGSYDTTVSDFALDMGGVIPVNPCTGTNTGYTITATSTTATVSSLAGVNCGSWTPMSFSVSL